MKRVGSRNIILIVGVVLGLAIIGYAVAAYAPAADERSEGSKNDTTSDEPSTQKTTFTGELVCLPHKGDPEVTTMECAFGLKDSDTDVYYALRDEDAQGIPSFGTIPTGETITVEGVFQKGESDVYDIAGTIAVTSVKQ